MIQCGFWELAIPTITYVFQMIIIINTMYIQEIFRDGQSCFDEVDVQQRGDHRLMDDSQVIVPRSTFSCNGRLTGYLISLDQNNGRNTYPHIQIWRPATVSVSGELRTRYVKLSEYILTESDITEMTDYHLANVSFAINETTRFQPNDAIGYYHPDRPCYRIWSIDTVGYTSYSITTGASGMDTITTGILDSDNYNDRQPLIKTLYGMISYIVVYTVTSITCCSVDIQCDNIANGEITSCSSGSVGVGYEGDICNFMCNTGYELTGSSDTRTCQSDGSWSGNHDVCRRGNLVSNS